jgi:O-antigen/teichoic acid export membrane protein
MADEVPVSKRLMLTNSLAATIGRVVNAAVMIWLAQYLLRRLPASEYSLIPIVMGIMTLLPIFTSVLREGLGRYVSEALARSDHQRITEITSTMLVVTVGGGLLLAGAGWGLAETLNHWLRIDPAMVPDARLMVGLAVSMAGFQLAVAPFNVGLQVRQQFIQQSLLRSGETFLRAGLLLVLILGVSQRALWVIVAMITSQTLLAIATAAFSCRTLTSLRFRPTAFHKQLIPEITGFGLWTSVGQMASAIRNSANPLILNQWAGPFAVNAFHVGAMLERQFRMLAQNMLAPALPGLTALHTEGQTGRLRRAYLRGGRLMLWMVLAVSTPLIVYRHELVALYLGPAYEDYPQAATVLMLLLLAFALQSSNSLLDRIARATARVRELTPRILAIQLANVSLVLVLIAGFGYGAVACAAVTLIVIAVALPTLLWPVAKRLTGVRRRTIARDVLLPGCIPALVAGAVGLLLKQVYAPHSWLMLGGMSAAVAGVYGLVVLGLTNAAEREDLMRILRRLPGTRAVTSRLAPR